MQRYSVNFNPLPPCGGRLNAVNGSAESVEISIHSLRVEGDAAGIVIVRLLCFYFNPLPPCGGRLLILLRSQR